MIEHSSNISLARRGLLLGLAAAPLAFLGGCAGIGSRDRDSDRRVFGLSAIDPPPGDTVPWQLAIEEPAMPALLDRARIALRRADGQFAYFADANWSDRLGALVKLVLLESFGNSDRIVGLAGDPISLSADYLLRTAVRDFQAHYVEVGQAPVARIAISAQLVRLPERVAVEARTFRAEVRAERDSMHSIAAAFDKGFGEVQAEIVDWTLAAGQAAHNA